MSNLASPSVPRPGLPRQTRRLRSWILAGVVAFVVLVAAASGYMVWRMNFVPADLDYATTRLSEQGHYSAAIRPDLDPIPINRLHSWVLHVETADGEPIQEATIAVDGDMPQHGHGMPTRPVVTQNLGNGDYLVEGMKFQMGGWWVIDFTITSGNTTDKVSFNLMLQQ